MNIDPEEAEFPLNTLEAKQYAAELLKTPEGREKVVASLKHPLRLQLMRFSVPLHAFRVLEENFPAPEHIGQVRFELSCSPALELRPVPEEEKVEHTVGLFSRLANYVRATLSCDLDSNLLKVIKSRSECVTGPVSQEALDSILGDTLFMNPRDFERLRKEDWFNREYQPTTHIELVRAGLMGLYKNVQVLTDRLVEPDFIYGCGVLGDVKLRTVQAAIGCAESALQLEAKMKVEVYLSESGKSRVWQIVG